VYFVWISEQTAIISLCSINRLFFFLNREGVCLLRGTDRVFVEEALGLELRGRWYVSITEVTRISTISVINVQLL